MRSKVILNIPGYKDVVFDYYEDLNIIWQVLDEYPEATLTVVYDKEISENIETETKNKTTLSYKVPKAVTFTQRFQDRIIKEITSVLNAVYPDNFNISNIYYTDVDDDKNNMMMYIDIDANNENAVKSLKYLDENVQYIIGDLVNYYID